jgi:predicted membrane protein
MINKLTTKDEGICNYTGAFGVLITLTCVIQLCIYGLDHWLNTVFLGGYLFIMASFLFLALLKNAAPVLLIISTVLALAIEVIYTLGGVWSPIVIIQFLYTVAITFVIYMDGFPAKLRQRELAKRAEEDEWRGKL